MIQSIVVIIAAYLLGCFNTGYYLVRLLTGQDIRTVASGNTGSRNVGRLLGAKGFILTLIGDAGKGLVAVWLVHYLDFPNWLAYAVLLAVVAGHIWPVQLGFRGGKGFATLAGGLVLLDLHQFMSGLLLCLAFYLIVRRTTKAGLLALAFSPAIMAVDRIRNGLPWFSREMILYCLLVVVILYAHRSNIRKEFLGSGNDVADKE